MSDNEVKDNFQLLSFDLRVAFRTLELEKAALQARVAELEQLIVDFSNWAEHKDSYPNICGFTVNEDCTCGLDDLIKRITITTKKEASHE